MSVHIDQLSEIKHGICTEVLKPASTCQSSGGREFQRLKGLKGPDPLLVIRVGGTAMDDRRTPQRCGGCVALQRFRAVRGRALSMEEGVQTSPTETLVSISSTGFDMKHRVLRSVHVP